MMLQIRLFSYYLSIAYVPPLYAMTTTSAPTLSPDAIEDEDFDLVVAVGGIFTAGVVLNTLIMLCRRQRFEYVRNVD